MSTKKSKGNKNLSSKSDRSGSPHSQSSVDSKGRSPDSTLKGKSPPQSKKGRSSIIRNKKQVETPKELSPEEEQAQKEELRRKYIDEKCTVLDISFRNGVRKEIVIEDERFSCYSDLQRAIARYTPRSKEMYWCQTSEGITVDPRTFKENQKRFRIIELHAKKMIPPIYPLVGIKWEFYNYSGGAPPGWVDVMEIQRKKKEADLEKEKEREHAMKMLDIIET